LACKVEVGGRLGDRKIADESPKGDGYGKAALLLAPHMMLRPVTLDGVPIVGETLTVGAPFNSRSKIGFQ